MDHSELRDATPHDSLSLRLPPRIDPAVLFRITDELQRRYATALATKAGAQARRYLRFERVVPDWLVEHEGLGFVADNAHPIREILSDSSVSLEALAETGVIQRNVAQAERAYRRQHSDAPITETLSAFFADALVNDPRYYRLTSATARLGAEHREWITLPVRTRDAHGTVRNSGFLYDAASLRHAGPPVRHIVEPPDTSILTWRDTPNGLEEARDAIRRSGRLVITRGTYDRLSVRAAVQSLPEEYRPGVVGLGGLPISRLGGRDDAPLERVGALSATGASRVTVFVARDTTSRLPLLIAQAMHATGADVRIAVVGDGRPADERRAVAGESTEPHRSRRGPHDIDTPALLWRDLGALGVLSALRRSLNRDAVIYVFERAKRQIERAPPKDRAGAKIAAFEDALHELDRLPGTDASTLAADLRDTLRLNDAALRLHICPGARTDSCEPSLPLPAFPDAVRPISSPSTPKTSHGIRC